MERFVDLKEISDGKLYQSNDMVKADCNGCNGCFSCCTGMGDSIVLDPLDCMRLSEVTGLGFMELIQKHLDMHLVDGLILPSLKMDENRDACTFLDANGRCSIHAARPGFCRLFPLGRYYHDRTFSYFLQTKECKKEQRSKIKIKKWLDMPDIRQYEQFVNDWHYFLKDAEKWMTEHEDSRRQLTMDILQMFYVKPYAESIFYREFSARLETMKTRLQ